MYIKDLQKLLNSANIPNFFAFYGDNFQIELFSDIFKEKYNANEILKLYFDEYDFLIANDYLGSSSLFASSRLLVLKFSKKPPKKELTQLIKLCQTSTDNHLLLELYDESSRQIELENIFGSNFARFFAPNNESQAIELLNTKAKKLNIKATFNALLTLYQSFNGDLYLAASELNKFKDLNIDENTISKYCYSLSTISFDDFFDNIMQNRFIIKDIKDIIDNFNEIALINYLYSNFYKLFKITLYTKLNGKIDFKDLLGYTPPPLIASKLSKEALSLNINKYQNIFKLLLNSEYELKTNNNIMKKEYLIQMLIKLSYILK